MAEVKLPFDLNPELNTYHNLAHPLGILGGNIPDKAIWFPWLCNKYINCYYAEEPKKKFALYTVDGFYISDNILKKLEFTFSPSQYREMLALTEQTFIQEIKRIIESGAYIHGTNNERYVSSMKSYQKQDFKHDYLLYGFSDGLNCFYGAGYTANEKYTEYMLPYNEYYESIFQPYYKTVGFQILRFNPQKTYEISFKVIARDLRHYLHCTAFKSDEKYENLYGLAAWQKLLEYISSADRIDLRSTKTFMEHHKLMHMRLDYLRKQGIIKDHLAEQYLQAKDQANQAYLLSIKYNLTQRQSAKNSCIALIENAIELDKAILPDVISQIEKNTNAE